MTKHFRGQIDTNVSWHLLHNRMLIERSRRPKTNESEMMLPVVVVFFWLYGFMVWHCESIGKQFRVLVTVLVTQVSVSVFCGLFR